MFPVVADVAMLKEQLFVGHSGEELAKQGEKAMIKLYLLIVMKKGRLMSVIIKNWENRARDYKEQR